MVVEMEKLNLLAMSYDRDSLLDALGRTGAAEIKFHSDIPATLEIEEDCEDLRAYYSSIEAALEILTLIDEAVAKEEKRKPFSEEIELSFSDFFAAKKLKASADKTVEKIYGLKEHERVITLELNKLKRTIATANIYSAINCPLDISGTAHVKYFLGTIPPNSRDNLLNKLSEIKESEIEFLSSDGENQLIFAAAHKNEANRVLNALQECAYTPCPFKVSSTGAEYYIELKKSENELNEGLEEISKEFKELLKELKKLKIYSDFVSYELEKRELSGKLRKTQTTFLLEAYIPKDGEELIKSALDEVTSTYYAEFSPPEEGETPPTLLKNNKVIKNFESVTNMYSPVNYKEFDPNTIMAVFYSIFLGFIMADIGYGLLMLVMGGFMYFKTPRDTGMKRLSGVFAVGGIFAIFWGFLFNSFFGISLNFMGTVLPDAQKDMWSLAGIKVPAVLIISLLLGTVQLCAGYICRAVQCARRGQILDAVFDGTVWAVFTIGAALAIVGFVDEFNLPVLKAVGGITAGVSLVIAMLTAGRHEKLLGKFTKGFGAAYGIINFASDILSYARLYGLMLSGAVIAQIISSYSIDFITGGNPAFIILGAVLMLIGHAFNLAIGLLGAYIHDARLQYVEFYGRFYEGEGELFAPLGSSHKYIYVS